VGSGLIATLAAVDQSATWQETRAMPQTSDTALLILDFQVGIGDPPYATSTAQRAAAALKAGRAAGLPVVFSKVKFRAGYRDIADSNKAFALFKIKNLFPPDASKLISILQPGHDEIAVDKDRFCAPRQACMRS
jgi:nicotinamidase-related amidase